MIWNSFSFHFIQIKKNVPTFLEFGLYVIYVNTDIDSRIIPLQNLFSPFTSWVIKICWCWSDRKFFFVDCLYGFEINRLCCLHQQGLDYIVTVSLYSHWCVTCFICSLKPFLFVSAVWRASISSLCGLWMRLHSDCQQSDYMRPHSLQLPFAAEALALYRGSQEIADSNPFSLFVHWWNWQFALTQGPLSVPQ